MAEDYGGTEGDETYKAKKVEDNTDRGKDSIRSDLLKTPGTPEDEHAFWKNSAWAELDLDLYDARGQSIGKLNGLASNS
jgi:hypothetical protein